MVKQCATSERRLTTYTKASVTALPEAQLNRDSGLTLLPEF